MDREQSLYRLFGKFYPEGTILFREQDQGEEMFLVQGGAVRLGGGGTDPPREVGPGDFLGEEAFLGRAARGRAAEIVRDSRLLLLREQTAAVFARQGPEAAGALFVKLLEACAGAQRALDGWTLGRALRRLEPLLAPGVEFGAAELAERAGLEEAEVLSVLRDLVRRGALSPAGRGYRVADAVAIERIAAESEAPR